MTSVRAQRVGPRYTTASLARTLAGQNRGSRRWQHVGLPALDTTDGATAIPRSGFMRAGSLRCSAKF